MELKELLSFDFLMDKLKDVPVQDKALIIAELKAEAQKLKCVKPLNDQIKLVEQKIADDKKMQLKTQKLADIPQVIKDCAGYGVTEYGITTILPQSLNELVICPKPLFVVERYQDIEDNSEKVKFTYKSDGKWYDLVLDRQVISNSNRIISLADYPTGITTENAKNIVRYLNDIESANRDTIPIKIATSKLGWTEYGFVPFVDDIAFAGGDTYRNLYSKFHEEGDFDKWKDISIKCLEHKLPKLYIAGAYASLLLKDIGVNGFCVHIWGESGKGKTVAMMLAASVYGDSDSKTGIIRNGKSTENGIEPVLNFFNDCACFFDELTTLSHEQIEQMIYKFTQGQSKGRMTKGLNVQKNFTWNNVVLLNAEKPLSDTKSMSGAVNRVISMYTDSYVFGDMDMKEIADTLRKNYGFGAKLFINAIKENNIDVGSIFKKYLAYIPENIERKQANAISTMMTAYEIACKYVYQTNDTLTLDDVKDLLITKDEVSVVMRAYQSLIEYAQANYTLFNDVEYSNSISKWGKYATYNNERYLLILSHRFDEWCAKNNFNQQMILKGLNSRNLLKTTGENRLKFKTTALSEDRNKTNSKVSLQDWFIAVKLPKEEENDNNGKEQNYIPLQTSDDDLPF